MARFDDSLFGRVAVLNGYVTKEQLAECAEASRSPSNKEHLGEIMLRRGLLTREQLDRLVEIRDKKVRKLLRSQEESARNDREFCRTALQMAVVDLEDLESAMLEQQRLRQLNLHFGIAEVLVSRRTITVADLKRLYGMLGQSMLRCCYCDLQFRIADSSDGNRYSCPRCEATLEQPAYLDPLMAEAVLAVDDVQKSPGSISECSEKLTA
jgi:hypothetical protein